MFVVANQLIELGISEETLNNKLSEGEWKTSESLTDGDDPEPQILLSSLPKDLQIKIAERNAVPEYPEQLSVLLSEAADYNLNENTEDIVDLLAPLSVGERIIWLEESLRLARILEKFINCKPKRKRNPITGKWEFVEAINELRREAVCNNTLITTTYPHRAERLSAHQLDRLARAFRKKGIVALLPKLRKPSKSGQDNRRVKISKEAIKWLNKHFRRFKGARALYDGLKTEAKKRGWKIPSESWLYRQYASLPEIIKTYYQKGKDAYESKYGPYVPRDYSDLEALQVLCGDHSERDVFVLLPRGRLARPWVSMWLDLRCDLIWGWHLNLTPSSYTAGRAYADGVRNFGAQPLSRPDDDFYSYVYTDRGRDYKSHNWDGKVIKVHKKAMSLGGGVEWLLVQQRVGILHELGVEHITAKRRNAKEKPIERTFRIISEWEKNTFEEYCGPDAKNKPDALIKLFKLHQDYLRGKRAASPFITFEEYRERFAQFIIKFNNMAHLRTTLGGQRIVPIDEFNSLYTTKYEISEKALAIILMKPARKKIHRLGVEMFRKGWFYYHPDMSKFKNMCVEIRYSDEDYSYVWIILPNSAIRRAELITPTSILKPNKQTLKVVNDARKSEKAIIREYQLITESNLRGETIEDRIALELDKELADEEEIVIDDEPSLTGRVQQMTRFDKQMPQSPSTEDKVPESRMANTIADTSIFNEWEYDYISELIGEE